MRDHTIQNEVAKLKMKIGQAKQRAKQIAEKVREVLKLVNRFDNYDECVYPVGNMTLRARMGGKEISVRYHRRPTTLVLKVVGDTAEEYHAGAWEADLNNLLEHLREQEWNEKNRQRLTEAEMEYERFKPLDEIDQ